MRDAAGQTDDRRLQTLAVVTTALAGANAADALQRSGAPLGGVKGAKDTHCPTTPIHSLQRAAHAAQHSERMNDKFASATYGANLF
jgi:hypothetical protein